MLFLIRNIIIAFSIVIGAFGIVSLNETLLPGTYYNKYIPLISQQRILQNVAEGKRVVFVDSRETPEFFEERIPGARNLVLRNISSVSAQSFSKDDIVVAYCLKDFRGFEVAKSLKKIGVKNVYTMAAPGLNAWKNSKLPVEIPGKIDTEFAIKQLKHCAESRNECGVLKSDV